MPHNLFSGKKELIQSRVNRSSTIAIAAFSPGVAFVSGSCDLLVAERFLLDFMARTLSPWASGLVLETSCGAVLRHAMSIPLHGVTATGDVGAEEHKRDISQHTEEHADGSQKLCQPGSGLSPGPLKDNASQPHRCYDQKQASHIEPGDKGESAGADSQKYAQD